MSLYHHSSGAEKRRRKRVRDKETKAKSQSLFDMQFVLRSDEPSQELALPIKLSSNDSETSDENSFIEDNYKLTQEDTIMSDIGYLTSPYPSNKEREEFTRIGPPPLTKIIPPDNYGRGFSHSIFKSKRPNGEIMEVRNWLVFSPSKNSLFCFPCRLFASTTIGHAASLLATPDGHGQTSDWKKLSSRVPHHEHTSSHKLCYLKWRQLEARLKSDIGIDDQLVEAFKNEKLKWRDLLKKIVHVTLFISERGLAFQGDTERIGDVHNRNFLGIIELLSHYDTALCEHVARVKESQTDSTGKRIQAHYLSHQSQNEFISLCGEKVRQTVGKERETAKYFSLMIDSTPDVSHNEQNTFILRYLTNNMNEYKIQERFYTFINNFEKTGAQLSLMIITFLKESNILFEDCRGQGYDNAANMSGIYSGVQSHLKRQNPLCLYSPCACHSLNLCGNDAAESCNKAVTFFGTVQTVYNIFTASVKRWGILQNHIGASLHRLSETRWTARISSIRVFSNHLPGVLSALESLEELNLLSTSKTKSEVSGIKKKPGLY